MSKPLATTVNKPGFWHDTCIPTNVPIFDAVDGITFVVTGKDISKADAENGTRNPECCVVAQGIKRVLNKSVRAVKIGATVAYVHWGDSVERFSLSQNTRKLVYAYDAVGFYPPGVTVKLNAPAPTSKLGRHTVGKKSKGTRPGRNIIEKAACLRNVTDASR